MDGKYGKALFDKPYRIKFHDFVMDVRALSIVSTKETMNIKLSSSAIFRRISADAEIQRQIHFSSGLDRLLPSSLTMWGGMQLSDNLSLDSSEDLTVWLF
jgi:hypothetical protein